jgi:hypothetical protein
MINSTRRPCSRSIARCLVVLAICAATACVKTQPYATLADNADPLRRQFNQDVGRVRVMMLVAPT